MTLEARDLACGFPGHVLARNVALELRPGEVFCLLGPNGAGKTTLFRTLLGLQPALGGAILFNGEALAGQSPRWIARRLGYVPQAHAGYFPFMVRDVVLMGRTAHMAPFAAPSKADRAAADAAIHRLGLTRLVEAPYTRLSGGERQLVLIARALAAETSLLVMDEPTASLDFGNRLRVLDVIAELAADGIGVLFSTHDPDQAFLCADRVALLSDGKLRPAAPPEEAVTAESLRQIYGVDIVVANVALPDGRRRRACLPATSPRPNKS